MVWKAEWAVWKAEWVVLKNGERVRKDRIVWYGNRGGEALLQVVGAPNLIHTGTTVEEMDGLLGRIREPSE